MYIHFINLKTNIMNIEYAKSIDSVDDQETVLKN